MYPLAPIIPILYIFVSYSHLSNFFLIHHKLTKTSFSILTAASTCLFFVINGGKNLNVFSVALLINKPFSMHFSQIFFAFIFSTFSEFNLKVESSPAMAKKTIKKIITFISFLKFLSLFLYHGRAYKEPVNSF